MADAMSEDELEMAVRGTEEQPGLARTFGWLVYHTRRSTGSDPGFPDEVFVREQRLLLAELKTQAGRLSAAQKEWRDKILRVAEVCPFIEYHLWRPSDFYDGTIERVLR